MASNTINIAGLDKAAILAALFNNSRPIGMGILQALMQGNDDMTYAEAQALIDRDQLADNDVAQYGWSNHGIGEDGKMYYFDYVRGRPMKIDLSKDEFNPWLYDRDNGGDGTAERIINTLR